jgi:hypothetical protein
MATRMPALPSQAAMSAQRAIAASDDGMHHHILETMQRLPDRMSDAMNICRSTVEHVFGTFRHWTRATHILPRAHGRFSTETRPKVLAWNLKRVMNILGYV